MIKAPTLQGFMRIRELNQAQSLGPCLLQRKPQQVCSSATTTAIPVSPLWTVTHLGGAHTSLKLLPLPGFPLAHHTTASWPRSTSVSSVLHSQPQCCACSGTTECVHGHIPDKAAEPRDQGREPWEATAHTGARSLCEGDRGERRGVG